MIKKASVLQALFLCIDVLFEVNLIVKYIKQCFFLLVITIVSSAHVMAVTVGEIIPDCELKQFNDISQSIDLKQYKEQVLYFDFWASWCGPCAKSFPYMNKLEASLKSRGLQIIAVNLDENVSDAGDFLAKVPADFTLVYDSSQNCAKSFDVQAMPSTYLIDKQGIVRHVHLGFRDGEVAELQEMIEILLTEQ